MRDQKAAQADRQGRWLGANQRLFLGAKAHVLRMAGEMAQIKSGAFVGFVPFAELRTKSTCSEPAIVAPKNAPPKIASPKKARPESRTPLAKAEPAVVAPVATPPPAVTVAPVIATPPSPLLIGNGARVALFPLEGWPAETQAQASSVLPLVADALGDYFHATIVVPEVVGAAVTCHDDACRNDVAGALGAQRFVRGRLSRSPFGSTLALTVVRVPSAEEESEVEEQFQGRAAEAIVLAVAHLHAPGAAPVAAPTVASRDFDVAQVAAHRNWKPPVGWTLTAVGAAALATGIGVFVYERGQATALVTSVNAFNAQATQSPATYAQLTSARNTVTAGQTIGIVAGAVGLAALGAGIGILVSGTHAHPTALVPTLGGAALVGEF